MKQNVEEMLKSREGEYDVVEYYTWTGLRHTIHTDNIENVDECDVKDFWIVERDEVMDEEEYNESVLANCGTRYNDLFEEGTRVLVVVVKPSVKVF